MRAAAAATTPLEASLLRVQRAGAGLSRIGATMTRRITLPMVALGGLALKMSSDFEAAMTKVSALTLSSSDEIDRMRDSVLRLAGDTGVAPKALADALFVVASNGLRGATAMSVLENAAKASAAGLGEVDVIARAVGTVIQAFGQENISAAEATDILAATAKAGNFEITELAGALGRVLPTARDANVSFADVGGAIALMTRFSGDANSAITDLDSLLRGLVRPTQQSRDMLDELGISTDDVRESLGERGLIATLRSLDEGFAANGVEMDQFLRRAQAQRSASILLNASNQELAETFGITANAVGTVDNAFAEFAETTGFKAKQAFAEIQVALITLGDAIAGPASKMLTFVGDLAKGLAGLPGPLGGVTLGLAGMLALSGPLLKAGGRWVEMFAKMGSTAGVSIPLLAALAAAVVVVTATIGAHGRKTRETAEAIEEYARAVELQNEGVADAVDIQLGARIETSFLGTAMKRASVDVDDLTAAMERDKSTMEELRDIVQSSGSNVEMWRHQLDNASPSVRALADELGIADGVTKGFEGTVNELLSTMIREKDIIADGQTAAAEHAAAKDEMSAAEQRVQEVFDETGDIISVATGALLEYQDALRGLFDPTFAALDATLKYGDAVADLDAKQAVLKMTQADVKSSTEDIAAAQRDADDAARAALKAYVDQEIKVADLAMALDRGEVSQDELNAVIDRFASTSGPAGQRAADDLRNELLGTTMQAEQLTGRPWVVNVGETGNRKVQRELTATERAAMGIPQRRGVHVSTSGTGNAITTLRNVANALFKIPTSRTVTVRTVSIPGGPTVRQHGGPVFPGRDFLVGEAGPELLRLRGVSGQVFSNPQSRAMMSQPMLSQSMMAHPVAAGAGPVAVDVRFQMAPGVGAHSLEGFMSHMIHRMIRNSHLQMTVNGQRVRVG